MTRSCFGIFNARIFPNMCLWLGSLGANLTMSAVSDIMKGNVENPEVGVTCHEFQQLVYIVYQIKS